MTSYANWTCGDLCWKWNSLTAPNVLRTDEKHAECRAEAKRIRAEISRRYVEGIDYRESECSARLYPTDSGGWSRLTTLRNHSLSHWD